MIKVEALIFPELAKLALIRVIDQSSPLRPGSEHHRIKYHNNGVDFSGKYYDIMGLFH